MEILNEKKLKAKITSIRGRAATLHADMHIVCVSALAFAAEHGRSDLLNSFDKDLNVNYRNALKDYIRAECGTKTVEDGVSKFTSWLSWSKDKGYAIVKGKTEMRAKFLADIQALAARSPFFAQNVAENVKRIFDDAALLKAIQHLLSKATKAADEGTVSATAKDVVVNFAKAVEAATPARASETTPKAA